MPRLDSGAEPANPDHEPGANRIGPRVDRALQRLRGVFLQAPDARLSLAELGRRVGLSSPAVAERIKRLEQEGVIAAYRANGLILQRRIELEGWTSLLLRLG